jgi:hypothetical protein
MKNFTATLSQSFSGGINLDCGDVDFDEEFERMVECRLLGMSGEVERYACYIQNSPFKWVETRGPLGHDLGSPDSTHASSNLPYLRR